MPDDGDNSGQGALWEVIGQMQAQIAALSGDQPVKPERRASADYAEMEVKWAREDIRDNDSKYSLQFQQQRMRIDELYRRLTTPQDDTDPSATVDIIPLSLSNPTGGAGDDSTFCSYAYDVVDTITGLSLGTGITVTGSGLRIVMAEMNAATMGLGYIPATGGVVLLLPFETYQQNTCSDSGEDDSAFGF